MNLVASTPPGGFQTRRGSLVPSLEINEVSCSCGSVRPGFLGVVKSGAQPVRRTRKQSSKMRCNILKDIKGIVKCRIENVKFKIKNAEWSGGKCKIQNAECRMEVNSELKI